MSRNSISTSALAALIYIAAFLSWIVLLRSCERKPEIKLNQCPFCGEQVP